MKTYFILGIVILALTTPVLAQNYSLVDNHKSVINIFHISGDTISYKSSEVFYGYAPENIAYKEFTGKTLGQGDTIIREFGISDPRFLYTANGSQFQDNVDFGVIVPFAKTVKSVGIYNTTSGALLARADLTAATKKFCNEHPNDDDCGNSDGTMYIIAISSIIIAVVACFVYIMMKRKKGE